MSGLTRCSAPGPLASNPARSACVEGSVRALLGLMVVVEGERYGCAACAEYCEHPVIPSVDFKSQYFRRADTPASPLLRDRQVRPHFVNVKRGNRRGPIALTSSSACSAVHRTSTAIHAPMDRHPWFTRKQASVSGFSSSIIESPDLSQSMIKRSSWRSNVANIDAPSGSRILVVWCFECDFVRMSCHSHDLS
ncbi:hypothetical protein OKW40_000680 [Paraburkholderia sp. RAU6.4a]